MSDQRHRIYKKLLKQFDELCPLIQLMVDTLGTIEPGGTLADEIILHADKHADVFISYSSNPLVLNIETGNKRYIFKLLDT